MSILKPFTLAVDATALTAVVGTIAGLLPPIAALAAILWYAIQILESKTVQGWINCKKLEKQNDPPDTSSRD